MLSNILASRNIDKKLVELVDIVANSRPLANREYDQIYMFTVDMIIQAELMSDYIKNKKVSLRLNVYQKNARAISFYQREGFIIQCEDLDEDTGEKEYTMLWKQK